MGDIQTQVTFDFAGAREVHYLNTAPEVGDFVTHRDELWVVQRIDDDDAGQVVTCELPRRAGATDEPASRRTL